MKISNDQNNIANISATVLFFLGVLILLKIGFVQWVLWNSVIYFFIIKDEKFVESFMPAPGMNFIPVYGYLWMMTILMPIIVLLSYLAARASGYSNDYDD